MTPRKGTGRFTTELYVERRSHCHVYAPLRAWPGE